jgi:hypothetical protein
MTAEGVKLTGMRVYSQYRLRVGRAANLSPGQPLT